MVEVTEELSVARSADEVWAVLAEFGGIGRWAPNVDHSCLTTAQDGGVGAVRRVQVGRNALLERVVEWEPGRRLGYAVEGLPPAIRSVTNTWQLDEVGSSTRVSVTSSIDAGPRPPQKLVARAAGRMLAKASDRMLRGLSRHLEEAGP